MVIRKFSNVKHPHSATAPIVNEQHGRYAQHAADPQSTMPCHVSSEVTFMPPEEVQAMYLPTYDPVLSLIQQWLQREGVPCTEIFISIELVPSFKVYIR